MRFFALLLLFALPAAAQTPIVSSVPWSSYTQSVQPDDEFSYTFTGTAGQVASLDLLALSDITQPGTQSVVGTVRITDEAGTTLRDDAYGSQILTWQANNTTVDGTVRSIQERDVGLTVVLPADGTYRVEVEVQPPSLFSHPGSYELRFNLLDPGAAFTVSDGTSAPTCAADTGFLRSAMRAVQAEGTVTACAGTHLVQRELYATVPGLTLQGESGTVVALGTPGRRRQGNFDELRFTDDRFTVQDLALRGAVRASNMGSGSPFANTFDGLTIANVAFRRDRFYHVQVEPSSFTDVPRSAGARLLGNTFLGVNGQSPSTAVFLSGDGVEVRGNAFFPDTTCSLPFCGGYGRALILDGAGVVVEGNSFTEVTFGLRLLRAEGALVENNGFTSDRMSNAVERPERSQFGTSLRVAAMTVRGNSMSGSNGTLDIAGVDDVLIERNSIRVLGGRASLQGDVAVRLRESGGTLVNNKIIAAQEVFANSSTSGLTGSGLLYESEEAAPPPLVVVNNTFQIDGFGTSPNGGDSGDAAVQISTPNAEVAPVVLFNNLFASPAYEGRLNPQKPIALATDAPLAYADYNFYDIGTQDGGGFDPIEGVFDPIEGGFDPIYFGEAVPGRFDRYGSTDLDPALVPQAFSEAVDAGLDEAPGGVMAPLDDFDGTTRPLGRGIDIGAVETTPALPDNAVVLVHSGVEHLGYSLAVGEVDGGRQDDLALTGLALLQSRTDPGASGFDDDLVEPFTDFEVPAVYLYRGAGRQASLTTVDLAEVADIVVETSADFAGSFGGGHGLLHLADYDADGRDDLFVGGLAPDSTGALVGAVFVFNADSLMRRPLLDETAAIHVLLSEHSVYPDIVRAADLNGNGRLDVVAGFSRAGTSEEGAVSLWRGTATPGSVTPGFVTAPTWTLAGTAPNEHLGAWLATGNLQTSGPTDLAVVAGGHTVFPGPGEYSGGFQSDCVNLDDDFYDVLAAGSDAGYGVLFQGPLPTAPTNGVTVQGQIEAALTSNASSAFGWAPFARTMLADLDGDGLDEWFIGASTPRPYRAIWSLTGDPIGDDSGGCTFELARPAGGAAVLGTAHAVRFDPGQLTAGAALTESMAAARYEGYGRSLFAGDHIKAMPTTNRPDLGLADDEGGIYLQKDGALPGNDGAFPSDLLYLTDDLRRTLTGLVYSETGVLGQTLAGGDVMGDNREDLLAGAPWAVPYDMGGRAGRTYLFRTSAPVEFENLALEESDAVCAVDNLVCLYNNLGSATVDLDVIYEIATLEELTAAMDYLIALIEANNVGGSGKAMPVDLDVCFPADDLAVVPDDRDEVTVYRRADASDDWTALPTVVRDIVPGKTVICGTGVTGPAQFAAFAPPEVLTAELPLDSPYAFGLDAAFPNPFSTSARIVYRLPTAQHVRLVVHDALGREVARLVDAPQEAGRHVAMLDAGALVSGVYLYRLEAGAHTAVRSVVVAR